MSSYASARDYEKWLGFIENRPRPEDKFWEVAAPDRTTYSDILKIKVTGANNQKIIREKWVTTTG